VFVAEPHHPLFDARGLVVEKHRHHRHQVSVLQFRVLELAEEVPGGLADHLAAPGVAVFVRNLSIRSNSSSGIETLTTVIY